eukprot:Nitzschia sp. Nitz4//scaffold79_size90958//44146//44721//NITZ4_005026-RA/size90958-processed-gene-0.113-mRNA-1//-1//CDS//3329558252//2804//frame0
MSQPEYITKLSVEEFCAQLASKTPTPGGGASAAVGAAVGSATSAMSAAYTQRKKDIESGAAEHATSLTQLLDTTPFLDLAQADVDAFQELQATWKKDCTLSPEEIQDIKDRALKVPVSVLEECHGRVLAVQKFLPHCNPNILSDALAGIHLLGGAARAAYQTIKVNDIQEAELQKFRELLNEIQQVESEIL